MEHLPLKDVELEVLLTHELHNMGEHLHAKVEDSTVTVSGTADNFQQKRSIETLVREFAGHRKVANHIRVIPIDNAFDNNRH
jgi:osmotically-inducible protein OsmY